MVAGGFIFVLIIVCEIVLAFLFSVIAQVYYQKTKIDFKSLFKGFAERMFLTLFLFNDLASALTFFSALKVATRLKHQESSEGESNRFNDYYLVGNLLSVSVALFYAFVLSQHGEIQILINLRH
jgi:hypothetical protein